ncbi:glycosyltransferase [Yoonia sp. GPGPB17]|uniref:glycosyltransferase n=1 Tax=Yoonia sp. GPGPB17 TaxID=3026147 RepID=UPI0030C461ED
MRNPNKTNVLVNAVSAKDGGARTIVEGLVTAADHYHQYEFIILAGFRADRQYAANIVWVYLPKSGLRAVLFNLLGVAFYFYWHRCHALLSLNNMNCVLVPTDRRTTYFHQPKALDFAFSDVKARIIRTYLMHTRDRVVVQSPQVHADFVALFGQRHEVQIAWPGFTTPARVDAHARNTHEVLVPVAGFESPHKNFAFVHDVAETLGSDWRVVVTARDSAGFEGVAENICFIGPQTREDLFCLYHKATVVLMPSTHETIGLPIFEALSVGTPVVAYDAPYIRLFQETFGITSGLGIAASAAEAKDWTTMFSNGDKQITHATDFRQGDWKEVFDAL